MPVMWIFELLLFLSSMILLAVGYRKDDRRILLAAWICLLVAFLFEPVVQGFLDGLAGR